MKPTDKNEILRYMGQRGAASPELEELVDEAAQLVSAAASPRHVSEHAAVRVRGGTVFFGGIAVESGDLAEHLCGCGEAVLFAATLGAQVDRLISRYGKTDSAQALCMQAAGAVITENLCDEIEHGIASEAAKDGCFIRARFSPGYGDFDIACQTGILSILQADKKIGLTETATHMLAPLKSVTAVVGISDQKETGTKTGCDSCEKTDCRYRKRGGKVITV